MKYLFLVLLVGCASTPKAAREWKQEIIRSEGMVSSVFTTGGSKQGTIVYFTGLGEDIDSPKSSSYDTTKTVGLINDSEFSHVLTVGYSPTIGIPKKSDIAFMLDPRVSGSNTTGQFKKEIERITKIKGLKAPLVGVGISQGGANLVTMALMYPEMFDRVVLLNPMLLKASEWKKDFDTSNLKDPRLMPGKHFSFERWQDVNPFSMLAKAKSLPKIFVTACLQDNFKLFDSTALWVEQAKIKDWHPVDGCTHFEPSTDGIVEFINGK